MTKLSFKILLLIFALGLTTQAQPTYSTQKNKFHAEFVFFDNIDFVKILEDIIQDKNECNNSTMYNWYIEFYNSKKIVVTKGYVGNLIATPSDNEGKQIYATTISNKIVFVLMKDENASISKTGFSIDLCEYVDDYDFSFSHFSAWLIVNNDLKFELTDSHIIKCN